MPLFGLDKLIGEFKGLTGAGKTPKPKTLGMPEWEVVESKPLTSTQLPSHNVMELPPVDMSTGTQAGDKLAASVKQNYGLEQLEAELKALINQPEATTQAKAASKGWDVIESKPLPKSAGETVQDIKIGVSEAQYNMNEMADVGVSKIEKAADKFKQGIKDRAVKPLPEPLRQKAAVEGGYTTPAVRGQYGFEPDPTYFYKKAYTVAPEDIQLAEQYAGIRKITGPGETKVIDEYSWPHNTQMQPVLLDTRDYLHFEAGGKVDDGHEAIKEAKRLGKKGVVMHNTKDSPGMSDAAIPATVYITLDPKTMKSKFASRFDPTSSNMLRGLMIGAPTAAGGAIAFGGMDEANASPLEAAKLAEMWITKAAGQTRTGERALSKAQGGIETYHATKGNFDKFGDPATFQGTGEGKVWGTKGDDFGYGVYTAQERAVGDYYQKILGGEDQAKVLQLKIKSNPESFIDFDVPFEKQSLQVQQALKKMGITDISQDMLPRSAETLQKMREAGISGVKFFDQKSRAAGQGTRNFTVFDNNTIDIVKKFGIAGLVGAGAGMAMPDEAEAEEAKGADNPWEVVESKPLRQNAASENPWEVVESRPITGNTTEEQRDATRAEALGRVKAIPEGVREVFHEGVEELKGAGQSLKESVSSPLSTLVDAATEILSKGTAVGTPGGRRPIGEALGKAASGAFNVIGSPILGAVRKTIGEPLEEKTGIPKVVPELAAGLVAPTGGISTTAKLVKSATKSPPVQALQRLLAPQTVSSEAEHAAGLIRSTQGEAARTTAQTRAELEDFHKMVNASSDTEKLAFIDFVEGRTTKYAGAGYANPKTVALANTVRDAFKLRREKLEAMTATQQAQFIDDYFPHHFEDPSAARTAGANFGVSKQGSGASLKKRTVPTIADGIAAGLKPVTTNPVEATLRYVESMDRFIASTEALEAGKAAGMIKYVKPKTVGASGHPDSVANIPDGWVPINGRGATRPDGAKAYAPRDWAEVYNNFIDPGFHRTELGGSIYDTLQRTSNAITSLELGLSGYHAFTMANEAFISKLGQGFTQMIGGAATGSAKTLLRGAAAIVEAPVAFITQAYKGHKFQQIYLGRNPGTPDWRKIVDLGEKAGGRFVGREHAPDYTYTRMGSYWTSFRRGALRAEMAAAGQRIADAPTIPRKVWRAGIELAGQVGRALQTFAQPLFEAYIPRLKNGAFYDTMNAWIKANPAATYDDQVKMARKIWDSIDNRFGETVQDNIFWKKTLKQTSMLGLRSYSWTLGTIQEIGGGVKALIKDPRSLNMASDKYDPRAAYVVAFPIAVATMNAFYQKLMTGKDPESVDDLMVGRTGGTAPGFGGRGEVPERALLPGYQKDVFGWYHHPVQEATNKMSTFGRLGLESLSNKDWRGDQIRNPNDPMFQQLQQYFTHVLGSLGPISVKDMLKGGKEGSNIGTGQRSMGIRPAGAHLSDPEGYERGTKAMNLKEALKKRRHELQQKRQYGGTSE